MLTSELRSGSRGQFRTTLLALAVGLLCAVGSARADGFVYLAGPGSAVQIHDEVHPDLVGMSLSMAGTNAVIGTFPGFVGSYDCNNRLKLDELTCFENGLASALRSPRTFTVQNFSETEHDTGLAAPIVSSRETGTVGGEIFSWAVTGTMANTEGQFMLDGQPFQCNGWATRRPIVGAPGYVDYQSGLCTIGVPR